MKRWFISALTYISSYQEKNLKKQSELKYFDNGYKPGAKGLKRIIFPTDLCAQNRADLKY